MTHLNYIYLNQKCSANFNKTGREITCTHIFCLGNIHKQQDIQNILVQSVKNSSFLCFTAAVSLESDGQQ